MTSIELKRKLAKVNEGLLKKEANLNDLMTQQKECMRKHNKISSEIGITNKKIDDAKREYFRTQVELDTRISEEQVKARQAAIENKKKELPTFENWLEKEFAELVAEIDSLEVGLGNSISQAALYERYENIRDGKYPTKENSILNEALIRYNDVLTTLIEKELDGGRVDLMEKRNLKQPVINFLNNQIIKQSLQI